MDIKQIKKYYNLIKKDYDCIAFFKFQNEIKVAPCEDCMSGIYPKYNLMQSVDEHIFGISNELLNRFDGIVIYNNHISLCDDSWDGFQPICGISIPIINKVGLF